MAKKSNSALACAENIALLSLLEQVPSDPLKNEPASNLSQRSSNRVLSFRRELSLADSIALIAGVSDNPNHVVAICIEELPDGAGIRVLLAINKKNPTSAGETLLRIQHGLGQVFSVLMNAQSEDDKSLEDRVLEAVVDMCRDRLLARIGCTGRKSFLADPLQQVLDAVKDLPETPGSSVKSIIARGNHLLKILRAFKTSGKSKMQMSHLKTIIQGAGRLAEKGCLSKILGSIKRKNLDPTTWKGLMHRLEKLSLYPKTARLLSQSARSLSIFRSVEVAPVMLAPEWFPGTTKPSACSGLADCLARCGITAFQKKMGEVLVQEAEFRTTATKVLEESKFHAEIQLIAHLELRPPAIMPRVISSSKAACYLCNMFIHLHGRFHVKKTHGRLYPGWRIPQIPAFEKVQNQLTRELAARIREVYSLPPVARRRKRPYPLESPAATIVTFISSVLSFARPSEEQHTRTSLNVTESVGHVHSGHNASGTTSSVTVQLSSPHLQNGHRSIEPPEKDRKEISPSKELIRTPTAQRLELVPLSSTSSTEVSLRMVTSTPLSPTKGLTSEPPTDDASTKETSSSKTSERAPLTTSLVKEMTLEEIAAQGTSEMALSLKEPSVKEPSLGWPDTRGLSPTKLPLEEPSIKAPSTISLKAPSPQDPSIINNFPNPPTEPQPIPSTPLALLTPSFKPPIAKPTIKTIHLTRGQPQTHRLYHPSSSSPSSSSTPRYRYTTGYLTINPEFVHDMPQTPSQKREIPNSGSSSSSWPSFPDSSSGSPESAPPESELSGLDKGVPVEMTIRWLPAVEETILRAKNRMSIDSGVFKAGGIPLLDTDSGEKERLYLQHRGDVVEVCVVRGEGCGSGRGDHET